MSILGVWMWPQSVRIGGAQSVVDRLSRLGVTDVYFLTKGLAGTTSYPSALAPQSCERNLLRELLDAAHKADIRVHAWLTSASDEHYKNLHPESGRCHYTRGRDKALISLCDPGYIAYMESIVGELCRRYDIDGLHLDYIRYNHLLYGWGEEDASRYAAAGADIAHLRALMDRTFADGSQAQSECIFDAFRAGDAHVHALANARRADVVHFAASLAKAARAENGRIILSAALMPEGAYDDTAFSDLHYGQNYKDAAMLYDEVLPMAYSKAYEKDSAWVRSVAEGTIRRGLQTVMGLHAYDGGSGPSLRDDIAALSGAAIKGVCLFRYGAFASAISCGRELCLLNTLESSITAVCDEEGASLIKSENPLLPGEERRIIVPEKTSCIRAFTEKQEACVYLTRR